MIVTQGYGVAGSPYLLVVQGYFLGVAQAGGLVCGSVSVQPAVAGTPAVEKC